MSKHQIFVSYSREDRAAAEQLARALERDGSTVWWDRKLVAGASFDTVIDEALTSAGCVIVLWSRVSVTSDWVKNEAAEGLKRKALVPVLLDDARIPLQFRHLHAVSLADWSGDAGHAEYENLLTAVRERTNATTEVGAISPGLATTTGAQALGPRRATLVGYPRRFVFAAVGGALAAAGVAWTYGTERSSARVSEADVGQLRNACRQLSRKLGARQETTGGYKANPYDPTEDGYVTGQVLYGLLASTQSGAGDFGPEPSARGAQAIRRLAKDFFPPDGVDATKPERGSASGLGAAVEPRVVPLAWSIMALARYLAAYDDGETRAMLAELRGLLLSNALENGSFQFSADRLNAKRPNAYATVIALMALLECRRILGVDETTDRGIATAASWIVKTYPSPSSSPELAFQGVNGLAAQAFWALEQAREVRRDARRTAAEDRVATLLLRDLLKACRKSASPEESCSASDGRIPNGATPTPLIMLWLPWSTLAAIELVRNPPRDVESADLEALTSATRTFIARLAARGDTNVDSYRYEPAEMLLAMAEALRRIGTAQ
jgi:hypothetical protein